MRRLLVVTLATAATALGLAVTAAPASACTSPPSGPFWHAPAVCLLDDELEVE